MINIFYRHYSVSGREEWRPEWFDYEKCFLNLINSIDDKKNVNITIIYDGVKDNNFIFNYDCNIIFIDAKSDYESFKKTINIIINNSLEEDEIIYLLENDYLHTYGWDQKVLDFFEKENKHYLSLYDHNDKYLAENTKIKSNIITSKSHHYRTTPSTCGSFIITKKVLTEDYEIHENSPVFTKLFCDLPVDHAKCLLLNQLKNRKVFTPIPGLSTHCLNGLLSPIIKWEEII